MAKDHDAMGFPNPGIPSREIPNAGIQNFAQRANGLLSSATSTLRFADTRANRVQRRYSIKEICDITTLDRNYVNCLLDLPFAPEGQMSGRERQFSVHDIMKIRAIAHSRRPTQTQKKSSKDRGPTLFWRKDKNERIPVITFASQKGGTGKTAVSAHVAQAASLYWGLRVGVIDCDPQASCSLYYANSETEFGLEHANTFTAFMGVPQPGDPAPNHAPDALDAFWKRTPWPGIRLIPGGPLIQNAEIAMNLMGLDTKNPSQRLVYRLLRDTIARWAEANPPRTPVASFFDETGQWREDIYQASLYETLDLIVIDTAPTLSLGQLNAALAADTLIVTQTMKGFDLSTLGIYLSGLLDYLGYIWEDQEPIPFAPLPSYVLPTIVSSHTDLSMVSEFYLHDPDTVCPVFWNRSESIANAAERYQSVYEYQPPKTRKKSADRFLETANGVSEAILTRAIPGLPPRGFANKFIRFNWYGEPRPGEEHKHPVPNDGPNVTIPPLWTEKVEE